VTLTENGELRFADHDKELLKVGGENVAASEVEAVLLGVEGVREVAIVGRPDAMLDKEAVAFIVATQAAAGAPEALVQRIQAACAASLADFKRPREIRIVAGLPRATLQKVAKTQLRARLVQEASK
jgi:crotonobetaine/carnitine-CoA ligase